MYLLDTDILIDVQRGYSPAVHWFSSLPEAPSVPVLVIMELIQDARDARQVRQALKLTAPSDRRLRLEPIRRTLYLQQEALQDDPRLED